MKPKLLLLIAVAVMYTAGNAQKKVPGSAPVVTTAKTDTISPKGPPKNPKEPKPYDKVITKDANTARGFIVVHKVEDKYFFELPDSMLGLRIALLQLFIFNDAALF